MADSKIKKVIIPKSKLPSVSGNEKGYTVRYRIVSEDKNRTSHWSAQYKLGVQNQTPINYAISVDTTGKIINVVWTPPTGSTSTFDVYVKWGSQDWVSVGQVLSPNYSALVPTGSTSVKVAVQVPTYPKNRFAFATLFETPATSVVV